MLDRSALWAGAGILLAGLLGSGQALATVKCRLPPRNQDPQPGAR